MLQANFKAAGQPQTELHIHEVEILNACIRSHDMPSILLGRVAIMLLTDSY